jgi:polyhydroxybutyrate depolymerase
MRSSIADGGTETGRSGRWRAACLIAIPVAVAACGSSGSSASSTTAATTATTAATTATTNSSTVAASASTGCGQSSAPGTVTLTPTIAGKSRLAIVHVPSGYHPATPVPLVVNMHGSGSTAVEQEGFTGMDATADADTFIVVYPQADIPAGSGFDWNVPNEPLIGGAAVPAGAPDDVSFIQQLVTMLEQKYCVDQNRVYATGFSGGARMASQLGCDASSVFAAVAPVSGLRLPSPCPSTRPVPVISFHGTADPVDPYNGNGQAYWTYSVPVAAQRWAAHNGCSATPGVSRPDPGVTLTSYSACTAGSAVELYTIAGEGHEWPGGPQLPKSITRPLGPQSTAISASSTMWAFFVAHPLT